MRVWAAGVGRGWAEVSITGPGSGLSEAEEHRGVRGGLKIMSLGLLQRKHHSITSTKYERLKIKLLALGTI